MKRDNEPNVWLTVVKLIVGAVILIGGVGAALYYVSEHQGGLPTPPADKSWGIASDSPINSKR
ncbi:hypothetical protein [Rhodoferax saidenbachensis]|uniref:Uncharacterized protein n=1 Tax=Rhodoferax saidenbachensis TaxID=1484693 RepID=A0A1P8K7A7_9BURK|nr:hypothetical protein [Rhodoferax saidenbachensis]APW41898.1 hypothetical protein RS694_04645 [Rhodoferax saidenbachensis]